MSEHAHATEDHHAADHHATDHHHGPLPADDKFDPRDLDQFSDDDTQAGTAIGKMLALFFLYTVIAMSLSAWWTYSQK